MNLLRHTQKPAARHAHRAEQFRCVLIFPYAGKPFVQGGEATSKDRALQQWAELLTDGDFQPGSGRRALVMADADYRHLVGGA